MKEPTNKELLDSIVDESFHLATGQVVQLATIMHVIDAGKIPIDIPTLPNDRPEKAELDIRAFNCDNFPRGQVSTSGNKDNSLT